MANQFTPTPIAWDATCIGSDGVTYAWPVVGFVWDGKSVTTLVARGKNIGDISPVAEVMQMADAATFHLVRPSQMHGQEGQEKSWQ